MGGGGDGSDSGGAGDGSDGGGGGDGSDGRGGDGDGALAAAAASSNLAHVAGRERSRKSRTKSELLSLIGHSVQYLSF